MKDQINQHSNSQIMLHVIICGIILFGIFILQYRFPVSYIYVVNEDSWVEYGTFVCYLTAAIMLFRLTITNPKLRNCGHIFLCMGLFFVAMEEISWGQRLLGIKTPHFLSKYNTQSELNFHNALYINQEYILSIFILIWAVVIPQLYLRVNVARSWFNTLGVPIAPFELQFYFVIGLFLKNSKFVIRSGEWGELVLGMTFLVLVLKLWRSLQKRSNKISINWGRVYCIIFVVVFGAASLLTIFSPKQIPPLKSIFHMSAANALPNYDMYDQSIQVFEYIRSHAELQTDETLLEYGRFLKKIGDNRANAVLSEALKKVQELKRASPDRSKPNILAGKIYKELENNKLANIEFQESLRKESAKLLKSKLNWQKFETHQSIGNIYMEIGNVSLAINHFEEALKYGEEGEKIAYLKRKIKKHSQSNDIE